MAAGIQNDSQLMPECEFQQVQGWWSIVDTTSGQHFAGHSGFPADSSTGSWEVVDSDETLEAGPGVVLTISFSWSPLIAPVLVRPLQQMMLLPNLSRSQLLDLSMSSLNVNGLERNSG